KMTMYPCARSCSATRSYALGATDGVKPLHPETKTRAGWGPGPSGRNVRYPPSAVWAKLEDTQRSMSPIPLAMLSVVSRILITSPGRDSMIAQPNARGEPRLEAGARHERTLAAVACKLLDRRG